MRSNFITGTEKSTQLTRLLPYYSISKRGGVWLATLSTKIQYWHQVYTSGANSLSPYQMSALKSGSIWANAVDFLTKQEVLSSRCGHTLCDNHMIKLNMAFVCI